MNAPDPDPDPDPVPVAGQVEVAAPVGAEQTGHTGLAHRRQQNADRAGDMAERAADEASRALGAAQDWVDNVREGAEQRVGSGDTTAVVRDPLYNSALEVLRTVEAFSSATEHGAAEIRKLIIDAESNADHTAPERPA